MQVAVLKMQVRCVHFYTHAEMSSADVMRRAHVNVCMPTYLRITVRLWIVWQRKGGGGRSQPQTAGLEVKGHGKTSKQKSACSEMWEGCSIYAEKRGKHKVYMWGGLIITEVILERTFTKLLQKSSK